MRQIVGKNVVELPLDVWRQKLEQLATRVIDVGAGDGLFAYRLAEQHPDWLVVACDADKQQFVELSNKANRAGMANLIFLWHAVEQLPSELNNSFDQIYVNYPWGSLLENMVHGGAGLQNLSNIAKPAGQLRVLLTYHQDFEGQTVSELQLIPLNAKTGEQLAGVYKEFGWLELEWQQVTDSATIEATSWAKRITSQRDRQVWQLTATKKEQDEKTSIGK